MLKVIHLHWDVIGDIWVTGRPFDAIEGHTTDIDVQPKDAIILQWSGFYDKLGNEIYQGDIVELVNEDNQRIRVVCEFKKVQREILGFDLNLCDIVGFSFKIPDGPSTFPIVYNYDGKNDTELFEVIGNIYQHPELLNEQL